MLSNCEMLTCSALLILELLTIGPFLPDHPGAHGRSCFFPITDPDLEHSLIPWDLTSDSFSRSGDFSEIVRTSSITSAFPIIFLISLSRRRDVAGSNLLWQMFDSGCIPRDGYRLPGAFSESHPFDSEKGYAANVLMPIFVTSDRDQPLISDFGIQVIDRAGWIQ
jgi:hypothetical protein